MKTLPLFTLFTFFLVDVATLAVAGRYEYDAYGQPLAIAGQPMAWQGYGEPVRVYGTDRNPGRCSAKYTDHKTGLVYFGYLYDSPERGRWINRGSMDKPGRMNLYGYLFNDPAGFDDPLGLFYYDTGQNLLSLDTNMPLSWQDRLSPQLRYLHEKLFVHVGPPGFAESFIPVWGSGRQALDDFQNGHYVWGTVNVCMAVSDVFLVKAVVTAPAWEAVRVAIKGGTYNWKTVSALLIRKFKGQEFHHWLIPRGGWGRYVPDWVKNQRGNLMAMPRNPAFHDAIHGTGKYAMNIMERIWRQTPPLVKYGFISMYGRFVNKARPALEDTWHKTRDWAKSTFASAYGWTVNKVEASQ